MKTFLCSLTISFMMFGCLDNGVKPVEGTGDSTSSLTYSWIIGAWGTCSATLCGTSGTQARVVQCRDSHGTNVLDTFCADLTKPVTSRTCSAPACSANSCILPATLGGGTLPSGQSVTAYLASSVSAGHTCTSQLRTCTNGSLSGSYVYSSCTVASTPPPASCTLPATLGGGTLPSGQSVTAYLASSVSAGQTCTSQVRTCTNGTLSGSYAYSSCTVASVPPPVNSSAPLVTRGQIFMKNRIGKFYFPNGNSFTSAEVNSQMTEKFNRYYTDTSWVPTRVIFVSSSGTASIANNSKTTPSSVSTGVSSRRAGDLIYFLKGTYSNVNIQMESGGGTYDNPIVFYGERNTNGTLGVLLNCKVSTSNQTGACFNVDGNVNYIAFDGFEVNGGKYGFRLVGGYQTVNHSKGLAVLNSDGHNQCSDPFFTGETDWFVLENNKAHHSGHCSSGNSDGHGIYVSNGGDWGIVRQNETYNNMSADFQINADPESVCEEAGLGDTDAVCDGPAFKKQGEGITEFYWIEGNYFHNGEAQGTNLTGTRNSVVINNVMAFMAKHGFTFWQESDITPPNGVNPDLGSNYNYIANNLFLNSNSHVLAFQVNSGNNEIVNNVVAAAKTNGTAAGVTLVEITGNSTGNAFSGNCTMGSTKFDEDVSGSWPRTSANSTGSFSTSWFQNFNSNVTSKMSDWNIMSSAPAGCPRLQFTDLKW